MIRQSSIALAPRANVNHSVMGTAFPAAATHTGGYQSVFGATVLAAAGFVVAAQTMIAERRPNKSGLSQDAQSSLIVAEHSASINWYNSITAGLRASDPIVTEVNSYRDLREGWDGEYAAAPNEASIKDACDFAKRLGMSADLIAATLDVDGSVVFEIDEDRGSIMFLGNREIAYALSNGKHGRAHFDGFTIPNEIMTAISA
jgi:hypothetical protein